MNEEFNELINLALADGEVTVKERMVILSKAENNLGVNTNGTI